MERDPSPLAGRRALSRSWPAGALALGLLAGCGNIPAGGPQDVDERRGNYEVEIVDASFADTQKLAKRSSMNIVVRNVSGKVIPNVAVTLGDNQNNGRGDDTDRVGDFEKRRDDENQSDPNRPQFVINRAPIDYFRIATSAAVDNPPDAKNFELERKQDTEGDVVQGEVRADTGDDPTYVDTYDLGRLKPGETRRFRWNVTATEAGPYEIRWRVHAGLDGRARAVLAAGGIPSGRFIGAVERAAPRANVDFSDGESVTR